MYSYDIFLHYLTGSKSGDPGDLNIKSRVGYSSTLNKIRQWASMPRLFVQICKITLTEWFVIAKIYKMKFDTGGGYNRADLRGPPAEPSRAVALRALPQDRPSRDERLLSTGTPIQD